MEGGGGGGGKRGDRSINPVTNVVFPVLHGHPFNMQGSTVGERKIFGTRQRGPTVPVSKSRLGQNCKKKVGRP